MLPAGHADYFALFRETPPELAGAPHLLPMLVLLGAVTHGGARPSEQMGHLDADRLY